MYIPPPFLMQVMAWLAEFIVSKNKCPLLVMGEFNDGEEGRLPPKRIAQYLSCFIVLIVFNDLSAINYSLSSNPEDHFFCVCFLLSVLDSSTDILLGW